MKLIKTTEKRTAFRVTRETELLGGLLSSSSSRETVAVSAQCLREDIPYFIEALGDVALLTKYTRTPLRDADFRLRTP
jgi:ubiquinol-cytochrome c reductase core subunit 2